MEYDQTLMFKIAKMKFGYWLALFNQPEEVIQNIRTFLDDFTSCKFQEDLFLFGTNDEKELDKIMKYLKTQLGKDLKHHLSTVR